MDQISRIKELTSLLNKARDSYYNNSTSVMTDYQYDTWFTELKRLEQENDFVMSNSPTQTVGYEVKSKLEKVTHNHSMLSLDKTKSVGDLEKFIGDKDCLLMLKLDGLTCSLKYLDGRLISAETRGNGIEGEDITHNAKVFSNIPLTIPYLGEFIVDGEAIITYENFNNINSSLPPDKEKYKTPRNLAAGSVRQLDSKVSKDRNIEFVAWKCVKGLEENSFSEQLHQLLYFGFDVVPNRFILKHSSSEYLEKIIEELKLSAEICDYPIDGLVIGYDDIAYGESLGATGHHLRSQLAFKFYDEEVVTKLRDIEWSMGKTGNLTPVAIFDSVDIDGTEVSRASLHNISILRDLKLGIGDEITVYKANQIIPQVKENLTKSDTLEIPETCPICGGYTKVKQDNVSKVLYCANPECKGKLLGKLNNFVCKAGMNIDGLSEETLNKLIALDILHDFKDIYALKNHCDEIVKLDGFGSKSVGKLLKSIEHSAKVKLDNFLYSLGIEGIGRSQSKILAKHFDYDWNKFKKALDKFYMFTNLDGFGSVLHFNIYDWYENRYKQENIPELLEVLEFQKPEVKEKSSVDLTGLTFVITGSLEYFENRDVAKEKIEELGGKVSGSVSNKTSYLVNNDNTSNSGKNKKAKELGIKIITEKELLTILKGE